MEVSNEEEESILGFEVLIGAIACNDCNFIEDIDNNGYLFHSEEGNEYSEEENGFQNDGDFDGEFMGDITIGKTFSSLEEAYMFYNGYARSKGFGTRKHYTNRHKITKEIYMRQFVCNKQGFKDMNDKRRLGRDVKRRSITRTGCLAMMQVSLSKKGDWVVEKFHDEHNHPLDHSSNVIKQRSHNRFHLTDTCKDLVSLLLKANMRAPEITKVVNAITGDDEVKINRIQCSRIVSAERNVNLGKECHGIIKYFEEKAEKDANFFFRIDLAEDDGSLRNVFWADGRSRTSYDHFGDVIVFDVTYKTNKFCFPFAPFVGVNHHGQSILFGAALLQNESTETFTWLFQTFLKCMNSRPPVAIITDQDGSIGKAIANVLPNTRHRFCSWHIQKHVLEHLQPLRSRYSDFNDAHTRWVKSQSIQDFESRWKDLKEKYEILDSSWLANMYKLRHHWAKSYLKDTFFAGMTSSGRSESIHSFFDGFVNSNTMLNEFVLQYEKAVNSRRSAEEDQDFRTLNSKPHLHTDHPIEAKAAECYTRNMYEIFKKEWKDSLDCGHETISKDSNLIKYSVGHFTASKEKWKIVDYRKAENFDASCSCAKFETSGILCKHILYIMKRKLVTTLPDYYILPRWTMNARYNVGNSCFGSKGNNFGANKDGISYLALWAIRGKFNKVIEEGRDSLLEMKKVETFLDNFLEEQNRRKKSRVEQIVEVDTGTIITLQGNITQSMSIRDPLAPIKTKGRPKIATRIKSGIEVAITSKPKRTCGYCKGKGHYSTGCQKRKMDETQGNPIVKETPNSI